MIDVINDPLGQTHGPDSTNHYFQLKIVYYCEIWKNGDGRMDGRHV